MSMPSCRCFCCAGFNATCKKDIFHVGGYQLFNQILRLSTSAKIYVLELGDVHILPEQC